MQISSSEALELLYMVATNAERGILQKKDEILVEKTRDKIDFDFIASSQLHKRDTKTILFKLKSDVRTWRIEEIWTKLNTEDEHKNFINSLKSRLEGTVVLLKPADIKKLDDQFFYITPPIRTQLKNKAPDFGDMFLPQNRLSILAAIKLLLQILDGQILPSPPTIEKISPLDLDDIPDLEDLPAVIQIGDHASAEKLKKLVPNQKLSPANFEVLNEKIRVVETVPDVPEQNYENISDSRDTLLENTKKAIEELNASNCDPRYLKSVETLKDCLSSEKSIVKLGLQNLICQEITHKFECELPTAVSAMINGIHTGISMYVAQYPEWKQFSENSNEAELNKTDIEQLLSAGDEIVEFIENNPHIAEPEVPQTIKWILAAAKTPGQTSKRAFFSVVRTLENFVSSIFQYGTQLIQQTAEKSITKISSVASIIITVSILGGNGLTTLSTTLSELSWVQQALELIKNQFPGAGV